RLGSDRSGCPWQGFRTAPSQRHGAHRTARWLTAARISRNVGVPGAAVLFRLAGRQGPLQADADWRLVGGFATPREHWGFHLVFWQAGEAAVGRSALSLVLFRGACAMDLFFNGARVRDQRGGGEPADYHPSLFSAIDPAPFECAFRPGGFRDFIRPAGPNGRRVWNAAGPRRTVAAISLAAGIGYGARCRSLAFRAERLVPRCALCHPVCDAVLAAGFARGISKQSGTRALAVGLWLESHGRCHRGIPVGADGPWTGSRRTALRFHGGRRAFTGCRGDVFPAYGRNHRRQGLTGAAGGLRGDDGGPGHE